MKQKHINAYMECAEAFAKCSNAERLQVGTVIVKNNRIISCGYNAQPEHIDESCEEKIYSRGAGAWMDEDEFLAQFPFKDDIGYYGLKTSDTVRHSEKSALMGLVKSSESATGATLFCTHGCCKFCSIDIVDAGIKTVYYKHDYRSAEGLDYLKQNGVDVIKLC